MAEKFRWIDKLPQHALFQALLAESEGQLTVNELRNLLAERNGEIFVWSPSKNRVLTTNLKNLLFENDRGNKYQELLCTSPPLYQVHMLRFSLTGKYLALVGHKGVTVLEMPQRWGRFAEYQGGVSTVSCRTINIDERFFTVHTNSMALEVKWHPASLLDSHLVVLTSDNTLRIYNILKPESAEQVINLGDPFCNEVNYSRSRMTSTSAFAIALGETSVAFDFAPPIKKSRLRSHKTRQESVDSDAIYPMFVLRENADVYYLVFELGNKGFVQEMVGPLTMHPATENNYGLDAHSILCLPLQPPVVVFATAAGRIYHCIVLETHSDDSESDSDESEKPSAPDLTLYVHECIELQRSLAGRDGEELSSNVSHFSDESVDSLNSCPVKLYPDPSSNNHYHCSHPSGVHTVVMPWIQRLQQFFVPDNVEAVTMFDTDEEALVYHMVCTTPTSESDPSPIHGLSIINDMLLGPSIICLTDNMECVARPLDLLKRSLPPQNVTEEEEGTREGTNLSPMRHLLSGSFVEHIRKLLTRNTSTPLLRARPTRDLSQKDCLEILTEAQQVLREEYIQKQNYAKEEIEKRVSILKDQKQKQQEDLERLLMNQESVHHKVQELAEKIEDVVTQDNDLAERIEAICQQIQTHIPVLSKAEKGMKEELDKIKLQVAFLMGSLSQIKAKHKHKTRRSSSSGGSTSSSPSLPLLNPTQQKSIRGVLKNESDTITDLVNQVKDLKVQVGL